MKSKICRNCNKLFLLHTFINGKRKSLQRRKFCLLCSPWGSKNTKSDISKPTRYINGKKPPYSKFTPLQKENAIRRVSLRGKKLKQLCVDIKGGKCLNCGYSKCVHALTFHHRDSKLKLFNMDSSTIRRKTRLKMLLLLEKCDLLCLNCHMKLHYELLKLKKNNI